MYTQEIACPKCGKLTIVNVIDKAGSTTTPCSSCKRKILVRVDKNGKVERVEEDTSCFLTTACVEGQHLSDNCRELTVLRRFRDEYVFSKKNGPALIDEYYSISPVIVRKIHEDPQAREILQDLFEIIQETVSLIDAKKYLDAFDLYCALVNNLRARFNVGNIE